ncbi:hypothetical protein GCM10027269_74450 [Kribbella endophytica]
MTKPCLATRALSTRQRRQYGDPVAYRETGLSGRHGHDLAGALVPQHHRRFAERMVPAPRVQIGAAQPDRPHPQKKVLPDSRCRDIDHRDLAGLL